MPKSEAHRISMYHTDQHQQIQLHCSCDWKSDIFPHSDFPTWSKAGTDHGETHGNWYWASNVHRLSLAQRFDHSDGQVPDSLTRRWG